MGVGLGGSGRHEQHQTMEENHVTAASPSIGKVMNSSMEPTIKEEAETSADSLTIDVEGHDEEDDLSPKLLKTEAAYSVEDRAWIQALRTHVVVPLIRHPKSISFRKPVDPIALGIFPSYNQIITQPMDLGTIKTNIDKGYYTQKDDLMADIQLVWNNAKKFNRPGHFVHEGAKFLESFAHGRIDKIKRDGPHSISRPIAPLPPPREQSKRDARKKSLDLPGETQLPQHLEQNRNATGSMRACETLLRNLMTLKQHREYVEPFIYVHRKADSELYNPMSLSKIQSRLKANGYNHPMEFADDVRRIITETYRYNTPKDPLMMLAGRLQSEFEMMFAKIDFHEDEIVPAIYGGLSEDDRFIGKLLAAQNFMVNIQNEVTKLVQDYMRIRQKDRKRRKLNEQNNQNKGKMPANYGNYSPQLPPHLQQHQRELLAAPPAKKSKMSHTPKTPKTPKTPAQHKPKGWPKPNKSSSSANNKPAPKTKTKQQPAAQPKNFAPTQPLPPPTPTTPGMPIQGMLKTRKNNLTLEDGNKLKQQIASLSGEQQMTVLEILKENSEHLEQDDEGNVEMEFREFSQKSIDDLKDYVKSVLGNAAHAHQQQFKQQPQPVTSAGKSKQTAAASDSDNSDSSSSSDSEDDDSDDSESD